MHAPGISPRIITARPMTKEKMTPMAVIRAEARPLCQESDNGSRGQARNDTAGKGTAPHEGQESAGERRVRYAHAR